MSRSIWSSGDNTVSRQFFTDIPTLSTSFDTASFLPDPYESWLPNSCLYEKYIPMFHVMKSYNVFKVRQGKAGSSLPCPNCQARLVVVGEK